MARKPFNMPPRAFGPADADPNADITVVGPADAPSPRTGTPPAIKRKLEGDGANLIFLTFTPGQVLRSHTTAHPITVQALKGSLTLTTEEEEILLDPGTVVHLRAMVVHEVAAPEDAAEENVLLLTMLTGERHSETPAEEGNSD
jgi:quercetin dioxygenase-like cupin family protein